MSRTLNGNLTGKAAQIDAYDRQQAQEEAAHQARAKHVNDVCQQIRNILTKKEYDAWWESTSVHGFGKQAEEKLAALKNDAMAAWQSEAEAQATDQADELATQQSALGTLA
jgi:hypothetical protein